MQSDSLQEAFRDVPKMILAERRVAEKEISRQLNGWATKHQDDQTWTRSSLIDTLPELIVRSTWVEQLGALSYAEPHCDFLFQCQMMNKVNRWVLENPYRDSLFSEWINSQKSKLPQEDGMRLEHAVKIFDWTVRNVWPSGAPKAIESLPLNPYLPLRDDGLGYTQLPWQTMISSQGDMIARARVYSQLAMQQDIPVGWIVLPGISPDQYKLWAIGIPVGDQIYLLEPRMGIPIPGPGQTGIATLKEAKSDPTILRRLKVTDIFDYPVSQPDLEKSFVVLDIEPMAVSRSMKVLENALTGDLRMKLSVDADRWKEAFLAAEPNIELRLWSLPWLGQQYGVQLREQLKDMTRFTANYMTKMGMYIDDTPVSRARLSHLAGNFASNLDGQGALEAYMGLRIDDETLSKLPFDTALQEELLIKRRRDEEQEVFQQRIQFFQGLFRQAKLEASLYLGMAHYDMGNFETSLSWLDRWMLKMSGTEAWHANCWYLMGRNCEMLGRNQEAIDYYKRSPSSQEAGNRIRARMLSK